MQDVINTFYRVCSFFFWTDFSMHFVIQGLLSLLIAFLFDTFVSGKFDSYISENILENLLKHCMGSFSIVTLSHVNSFNDSVNRFKFWLLIILL